MAINKRVCTDTEQFYYQLHVLVKEMGQAFSVSVQTGCTKMEMLCRIDEQGELSQLELQRLLDLDAAAITRHLHVLDEQGYVLRRKDEKDKRMTRVSLTEDGGQELRRLLALRQGFLQQMIAGFTDRDLERLNGYIGQLSDNITKIRTNHMDSNTDSKLRRSERDS